MWPSYKSNDRCIHHTHSCLSFFWQTTWRQVTGQIFVDGAAAHNVQSPVHKHDAWCVLRSKIFINSKFLDLVLVPLCVNYLQCQKQQIPIPLFLFKPIWPIERLRAEVCVQSLQTHDMSNDLFFMTQVCVMSLKTLQKRLNKDCCYSMLNDLFFILCWFGTCSWVRTWGLTQE